MIEQHVGKPCSHGTALLKGLIAVADIAVGVEERVAMVIAAKESDERRLAVHLFNAVKDRVDERERDRVEILRQVGLEAYRLAFGGTHHARGLLHDTATANAFLIRLA